jgi:hypothetical protein
VTKSHTLMPALGVLAVSLAFAGLFYHFAGDLRMSLFIFLVTAFGGSLFTMISIVTREN